MRLIKQAAIMAVAVMAAVLSLAGEAQASDRYSETASTTVRIDRAAIETGDFAAIRTAHNRIVRAARRVCRDNTGFSSRIRTWNAACVEEAVGRAVESAQLAGLSRYYAALEGLERYRTHRGDPDLRVLAALETRPYEVMFAAPSTDTSEGGELSASAP